MEAKNEIKLEPKTEKEEDEEEYWLGHDKEELQDPLPSCSYHTPNSQNPTGPIHSISSEIPRKKARHSAGSALVSLLLTCLVIPIIKGSPVEIIPFKSNPGIYFENLGVVNVFSSEWSLVAFYDMQPFWMEFQALKNCSRALRSICNLMNERNTCLRVTDQFQHLSEELSKNNELLKPKTNVTRFKRGAINIVGNIANALFGVLDSKYAEEMATNIDNINKNENHILKLIKNQTSIIDATVNVMKEDQEAVRKHFLELETHIDQFTNNVNQELQQEKISQSFTFLAMQAMLLASNFQRVQSSILDVMINTHHGKLSPQLISPTQLKAELRTIKSHLPLSLRLPIEQDDVLKLYNLMTIQGRAMTNYIIFRLKLPLLVLENFELFRVIPVPTPVNNTFVAIRPSYPLLVVNLHRDQYYPLTEQELHLCTAFAEDNYLCKQTHPIYRKGSVVSACEIDLLNNLPQSPSCKIMKTEGGPHWIQLFNPNQWIYVLELKTTINVVCGNNVTQYTIQGSGILKILSNCIIKQPLITIQGHNVYPSISRLSYTPFINLTNFVKPEQLAPILRHTSHYQPHLEELEDIKRQVLQINSEMPTTLQAHDIHQFTIGYIGFFLVVILIIYLIWNFRSRCFNRAIIQPIPAPRRHINQQTEVSDVNPEPDFTFNP